METRKIGLPKMFSKRCAMEFDEDAPPLDEYTGRGFVSLIHDFQKVTQACCEGRVPDPTETFLNVSQRLHRYWGTYIKCGKYGRDKTNKPLKTKDLPAIPTFGFDPPNPYTWEAYNYRTVFVPENFFHPYYIDQIRVVAEECLTALQQTETYIDHVNRVLSRLDLCGKWTEDGLTIYPSSLGRLLEIAEHPLLNRILR